MALSVQPLVSSRERERGEEEWGEGRRKIGESHMKMRRRMRSNKKEEKKGRNKEDGKRRGEVEEENETEQVMGMMQRRASATSWNLMNRGRRKDEG
jgi:hypothetical protein